MEAMIQNTILHSSTFLYRKREKIALIGCSEIRSDNVGKRLLTSVVSNPTEYGANIPEIHPAPFTKPIILPE